jgi:hypothetical protein
LYEPTTSETIFAESARPTARAEVAPEDASPAGLHYLLEVEIAREAIKVWQAWRPGRMPTLEDEVAAVVYYAQHDAWLPTSP